jgi:PD-(D/E)XK nuclease superfamily
MAGLGEPGPDLPPALLDSCPERLVHDAAVLDRDLVGTLDLVERDAQRRLVVVDLKTAARKYSEDQASYCSSFRACGAHWG